MGVFVQSGRFGGAWSPAALSPDLWLDADDASTFTYHSGTLVSQWADKSGNGYHATQATSGNAPSRSGTLNGLTTVDFDGIDNWMTCGDVLDLGTDNLTMYVVVKFDALATSTTAHAVIGKYKQSPVDGSWLLLGEYVSPSARLSCYYDAGATTVARSGNGVFTDTTGTTIGGIVDRDAGSMSIRADASTLGAASFTPDSSTNRDVATHLYIGALRSNAQDETFNSAAYLNGQIAEVVACLRVLTDDERDTLESHLITKWGTA